MDKSLESRINCLAERDRETLLRFLHLVERRASELSPEELREVRENAGLSRGQAAKLLGVRWEELLDWESELGRLPSGSGIEMRINQVYCIGPEESRKA